MKTLSLSGVLLFCLTIPFIMAYRIGPGETPFWLFGIIFLLLLNYLGLDLVRGKKAKVERLKSLFLWLIIFLVIGGALFSAIVVRWRTAPTYRIHDMTLQLESAIQFFLQGKNPYAVTYFGTPLEKWPYSDTEINPALFHFVMMPWYLLFSLPFYFLSISLFGFFDGRMPLIFLFIVLLILAWRLIRDDGEKRRLFLVFLAFNPATLGYFLEGRSDVFVFAFLFWAWFLLEKKRYSWAGIPLALALATKQSSWPIFPFYLGYLWYGGDKGDWGNRVKKLINQLLPFVATLALVVLPFAFWDWRAFWESTVLYLTGRTPHSYPISGYGWGMVFHQPFYPFWLWQLLVCLPLGVIILRWLAKSPAVWRLIFAYGTFTFVFWYFSRYFNNSHLGYLSMVFLTAYFWPKQ